MTSKKKAAPAKKVAAKLMAVARSVPGKSVGGGLFGDELGGQPPKKPRKKKVTGIPE